MLRTFFRATFKFLFALIIWFLIMEFGLRYAGVNPLAAPERSNPFIESDMVLGWNNKPGCYTVAYANREYKLSQNADHSRWTGPRFVSDESSGVTFIGDSFLHGYHISDTETMPYKVQQLLPMLPVDNFAVPGFGTVQSYLLLQSLIAENRARQLVIYGLADFHLDRNIGGYQWTRFLLLMQIPYWQFFPYGRIEKNLEISFQRLEDDRIGLPLFEKLASPFGIEKLWLLIRGRFRESEAELVTQKLLIMMNNAARQSGRMFAVVLLSGDNKSKAHFEKFLEMQKIPLLDVRLDLLSLEENYRTEDGHPNDRTTTIWSAKVRDFIAEQFKDSLEGH